MFQQTCPECGQNYFGMHLCTKYGNAARGEWSPMYSVPSPIIHYTFIKFDKLMAHAYILDQFTGEVVKKKIKVK